MLTAFSNGYGFDRDELYFAMLKPAWGYVDQPPLTPLLAHGLASLYDGGPWLLRVPATLCGAACVVVTALIARELGGAAKAQAWTAWGMATTSAVLLFGHVLLTSAPDLVAWGLVSLCVLRAELRDEPRWWLVAGAVAGLATYNKLLVLVLLAGIALGLATGRPAPSAAVAVRLGRRRAHRRSIGLPNVLYQLTHDLPQLRMGRALAENNAGDVRISMWVLLLVLLGPPLVVIWVAGLRALWRDRRVRFFVVVFAVVVLFTFVSGAQPHYPVFILPIPFAAGVVAMEAASRPGLGGAVRAQRRRVARARAAARPGRHASAPRRSPTSTCSPRTPSAGRRTSTRSPASYDALPDQRTPPSFTSNYGEAGAAAPLPAGRPGLQRPERALRPGPTARRRHDASSSSAASTPRSRSAVHLPRRRARLDNGVDVDNEEQGEPVAVCTGPTAPVADAVARGCTTSTERRAPPTSVAP